MKCDKNYFDKVYTEIANKLYELEMNKGLYKAKIELAKFLREKNLGKINDKSKSELKNHDLKVEEIDPFTFFSFFNDGKTDENRNKVLKEILNWLNINISYDEKKIFNGIPTANNQNLWFFPYQFERKKDDIDNLWKLFNLVIENKIDTNEFEQLFNKCLEIKQVATSKLTMGLYWIKPEKFISLDKHTKNYLKKEFNINSDLIKDFSSYKELLNKIKSKNFFEIVCKARNYLHYESNELDSEINCPLNQILYGPPGTGKTYKTIELAVEIVDKDFYEENKNNRKSIKKRFNELKKLHQIAFITFHQSFSYEDFIEGIKPDLNGNELRYKIEDGIFKRICNKAKENSDKNYVLIIDEINRGNIAKIFGELITLIEEDKRVGEDEELTTILPYSKSEFGVPSNLYIIGTMNTADRSLVYIDSALRRRFEFIEIEPNYDLLKEIDGINLSKLLKEINNNIENYYDKDHILGHSYFLKVKSKEDIERVFKKQIIPLLNEYFYEDVCMLERFLDCEECKKIEVIKEVLNKCK